MANRLTRLVKKPRGAIERQILDPIADIANDEGGRIAEKAEDVRIRRQRDSGSYRKARIEQYVRDEEARHGRKVLIQEGAGLGSKTGLFNPRAIRQKVAIPPLPYMLEDLLADGGRAEVVHTAVTLDGKTALVRKSAGIASHNRRMSCASNVTVEKGPYGLDVTLPAHFEAVKTDYVAKPLDGGRVDDRPGIRAEPVKPIEYVAAARTFMWAGNVRVQIAGEGVSH